MTFFPKKAIYEPAVLHALFNDMRIDFELYNVPMTKEQAYYSISIMMGQEEGIEQMYNEYKQASWRFSGFFKRCEIFPIKYEKRLLVWLACITYQFGIGGMILVAYYIQHQAKQLGLGGNNILTLKEVTTNIFAAGVFSEDTIHKFWDKQKVQSQPDNLIDYPSACASFMKIERTEPITHKDH